MTSSTVEVESQGLALKLPLLEYLGHVRSTDTWLAMVLNKGRPTLIVKRGQHAPWVFWSHEGVKYARTRGDLLARGSDRRQRKRPV